MNLNQVTVQSRDVGKAVAFYQRLGLRLIVDAQPRYVRFECPNGDATFSVHHTDEEVIGSAIVVYFECDDLDERVAELLEHNVEFDLMPIDQTWLWREAHLRDPDGNRLILYHAGENRKHPPWRI